MREVHAQTVVREHRVDRLGQRGVVAGRHQQPRFAVLDERLEATDARADYRRPAGHRLERDEAERLGERRHRADVRGGVVERELLLVARPDEGDVRFHAVLVHEAPQLEDLLGLGSVVAGVEGATDDEEADVAAQVGVALEEESERAQQDVDALDLFDATDEEDEALALVAAERLARVGLPDRLEDLRIDTARDHRHA